MTNFFGQSELFKILENVTKLLGS